MLLLLFPSLVFGNRHKDAVPTFDFDDFGRTRIFGSDFFAVGVGDKHFFAPDRAKALLITFCWLQRLRRALA